MAYRRRIARRPRARRPYRRRPQRRRIARRRPVRRRARRPMMRFNYPRSSRAVRRAVAPRMRSSQHELRLSNTEFIQDIYATNNGSFTIQAFPINIGQNYIATGSSIATCYETVEYHDFEFILKSTSGSSLNSVNAQLGIWGCAYADNVYYTTPQSKYIAEQMQGAITKAPFHNIRVKFPFGRRAIPIKDLYVLNGLGIGGVPSGQDARLYFPGVFYVFSSGLQTNTSTLPIGELWLKYSVTLRHVRGYGGQLAYNQLVAEYALGNSNTLGGFQNPLQSFSQDIRSNFSLTPAQVGIANNFSNGSTTLSTAFGGSSICFQFPSNIVTGSYLVNMSGQNGANIQGTNPITVSGTNCQSVAWPTSATLLNNGFLNAFYNPSNSCTQGAFNMCHALQITGPNAVVNYQIPSTTYCSSSSNYGWAGQGNARLLVCQLNGGYTSVPM